MDNGITKQNIKSIAYFRALNYTHQCELSFWLKISKKEFGTIEEQINAVRQITDTVSSLLQHIQNKINKLIATKNKTELQEANEILCDSDIYNIALKVNGDIIPGDMDCKSLIETNKEGIQFEIFQQKYDVIVNAPLVQAVHLPVVIYANFVVQPIRCKTLYTDRKLSKYKWYKSQDRTHWSEIGRKFTYKTKNSDLHHFLKFEFIPRNISSEGPIYEVISENPVGEVPQAPKCPFQERHEHTKCKLTGKE